MTTLSIGETATLAHGYTMADIERYARFAWRNRGHANMDARDGLECAWFAIVELIYTSAQRPQSYELINAGNNAIRNMISDEMRHHGRSTRPEVGITPAFRRYWNSTVSTEDGFTERLVERLALRQVLAELTPVQYEVLVAIATHDTPRDAASHLNMDINRLRYHLAEARKQISELWMHPETPRSMRRPRRDKDTVCRYGHARAEHSYKSKRGLWVCRLCARNASRRRRSGVVQSRELTELREGADSSA